MTLIRRIFAVALATTLISAASAQNSNLKIATVDMQKLFKHYHKTNQTQEQIDLEQAKLSEENNIRLKQIHKTLADLEILKKQIEDPSVNEAKRESLVKQYQLKQQEGMQLDKDRREYIQRSSNDLNEKMREGMKVILMDIRKVVDEASKADNYDFVIDKSGTGAPQVPILVYSKDTTDITAALLKILNKDAPPSKEKEND